VIFFECVFGLVLHFKILLSYKANTFKVEHPKTVLCFLNTDLYIPKPIAKNI